mgnify:CR=1 FL=1
MDGSEIVQEIIKISNQKGLNIHVLTPEDRDKLTAEPDRYAESERIAELEKMNTELEQRYMKLIMKVEKRNAKLEKRYMESEKYVESEKYAKLIMKLQKRYTELEKRYAELEKRYIELEKRNVDSERYVERIAELRKRYMDFHGRNMNLERELREKDAKIMKSNIVIRNLKDEIELIRSDTIAIMEEKLKSMKIHDKACVRLDKITIFQDCDIFQECDIEQEFDMGQECDIKQKCDIEPELPKQKYNVEHEISKTIMERLHKANDILD